MKSCKKNYIKSVEEKRDIFCIEYNLSFYKPRKDQCSLCNIYETRKKQLGALDVN